MRWSDQEFISTFDEIVDKSIEQSNYSLKKICDTMCLSRSQVHRRIKSITGLSTTHYIRKIRMKHAAQLLTNYSATIHEVSTIVGIKNVQNFSKYFKSEFGISPSQFKFSNHC